jgi:hypothetical protein
MSNAPRWKVTYLDPNVRHDIITGHIWEAMPAHLLGFSPEPHQKTEVIIPWSAVRKVELYSVREPTE